MGDQGVQRDFPSFLSEAQKAATTKEWNALLAIPAAPNYVGRQVIQWARKNPRDPRVPEALPLTVASTRYGCTEADTSDLSRAAFDLLQARYPQSLWARQIPYWY